MSIRIYNQITKRWELQTSLHAKSISVSDLEGNFKNKKKNVEECFNEMANEIKTLKKDIKYIYENGTIGGGGGGGSGGGIGAFPKLELSGDSNIIVRSENEFAITYYFSSPNPGDGSINYVISKKGSLDAPILDITKTIKQGRISHTFDPIPSGNYELSISVKDSQGISSNILVVGITCGALELTTTTELNQDVDLSTEIIVDYKISSIFKDDVEVIITYPDKRRVVEKKQPGTYQISLGRLDSLGVKTLTIEACVNDLQSNTLKFSFIVTDSTSMFLTTNFEGGEFRTDEVVSLNYRISLVGARKFYTDVYLNGQLFEQNVSSVSGHNFYTLRNLEVGEYYVTFKCRTLESVNPIRAEITLPRFTVISSEYRSYEKVKDSLVVSLDARRGKSNNQDEEIRSVWEDTELGKETITTLHDFAFNNLNGWVPDENNNVESLRFAGKSYVNIEVKPLSKQITNGYTFEIRHKSIDTGNKTDGVYNCILDLFRDSKSSGKGIVVDVKEAFARTSYADSVSSEYENDQWITHAIVINRTDSELVMYTNGCISSYAKLSPSADMLVDKTITLGARKNENGEIVDNANCEIQTFRIYNRPLTDEEIFKNYVSDLSLEEQDRIIALHEGQSQIPTLKLKFDESALSSSTAITPVDIEYNDPSDPSKNLILYNSMIQKQGTTSLTYPVSNYTINLYDGGMPYDYKPKDDWIAENIFTLKADYMDSSHANNTGIAAYTSEVFKRLGIKNLAQKEDPNVQSTIRGFIVNLYINGVYRGLYNFNTDRYGSKNYGLSSTSYKSTAVSYEAAANTGEATGFHTTDWNKVKSAFKVRYFKGETDSSKYMTYDRELQQNVMTQGTHRELERLLAWVNSAGNDENNLFYSEFKEHIDLDHALIYMLTVEIFGLMDNLEKNMVLTYFGEQYNSSTGATDEIWYPQLYDMDSSVGLSNNGELKYQPCVNFTQEEGMPSDHQYNGTTSLLWTNIKKHFIKELKEMYAQMRRTGILNIDTLMSYYQGETVDKVSPYLFSLDSRLKYITPSGNSGATYYHFCKGRRMEYTRKWLSQRIMFLDSLYEYGNENNPDGNFWKYIQARYLRNNNYDSTFNLKVKTTSPLFLLTVDDSMNPQGKKTFVNSDRYYDITVPINSAADGAMFGITFGPNIRDLKFPETIRLLSIYLEHGNSIVELDIPDNRDLLNVRLENCKSLQYVNFARCTKLGSATGSETIDFTQCPNIRSINIENTAVSGVIFDESGGILDTYIFNNSEIEVLSLKNQPYIKGVDIDNCRKLKKIEIESCNGISSITMPIPTIEVFRITDCKNLNYLNISDAQQITCEIDPADKDRRSKFLIDNCPKLETIVLSRANNKNMTWLDLINVENIKTLDISTCAYITNIRFSEGCTSLKNLICNDSGLKSFRFGRTDVIPEYLDFNNFKEVDSVNFKNCKNLKEIRNANFGKVNAINGNENFRNCSSLTKITGYLRLKGNMYHTFEGCGELKQLPDNLDLSAVTIANNSFNGCKQLPYSEMKKLLSKMTSVTNLHHTFSNCTGIITSSIEDSIFNSNTKLTSIDNVFYNCTGITGPLNPNIFSKLVNLTSITSPFRGCKMTQPSNIEVIFSNLTKLTSINSPFAGVALATLPNKTLLENNEMLTSVIGLFFEQTSMIKNSYSDEFFIEEDFFANNILITNLSSTFYKCHALSGNIPENLFANLTELTNLGGFIKECGSITGNIPENLFVNNQLLTNLNSFFYGCNSLSGQFPNNLLNRNLKLQNVFRLFYSCRGITGGIPENFLPTFEEAGVITSNINSVDEMFKGCSGLNGNIPNSLFENIRKLTSMSEVFAICSNLNSALSEEEKIFPKRIFRNKPLLTDVSGCFRGCSTLRLNFTEGDEELENMFIDNSSLKNISYLFSGCTYFRGSINPKMFYKKNQNGYFIESSITNIDGLFINCSGLTGKIPNDIFKSFQNITSMSEVFVGCRGLTGGIPYDLFYNCINLKSIYRLFYQCSSLGTNRDDSHDKCFDKDLGLTYIFHKDLFLYNNALESINELFNGSSLNGWLHNNSFFGNTNLMSISDLFRGTTLNVKIDDVLFSRNPKLTYFSRAFNCSGNISITPGSINLDIHGYVHRDSNGNIVPKNFAGTFAGSRMTGTAPKLWEMFPNAITNEIINEIKTSNTFYNTNVDNLEDIPPHWK